VFYVGVGLLNSHAQQANGRQAMQEVNMRQMFAAFCEVHAPARELMHGGTQQGELKGAPLRCSLQGATLTRPGLMVTGEAAGSTYAFTGEGIGKAMETGLLAASTLLAAGAADFDAAHAPYAAAIGALKPRFDLYERANRVNDHPWLADLMIWRARHSARILKRIEGVLEETSNPGNLFSARGIAKLILPIR
jgi:flavin-dependent dehydrogenase